MLRQGALKDGEGYTFTLHITDLTTGEEGFASIDLLPNQPPVGGSCRLSPRGPLRALMAKVHFECTGESGRTAVPGTHQPSLLLRDKGYPHPFFPQTFPPCRAPAPGHCWPGLSSEVDLCISDPQSLDRVQLCVPKLWIAKTQGQRQALFLTPVHVAE